MEAAARAREIVEDRSRTYRQRMHDLAMLAENLCDPPPVSAACRDALDAGVLCDLLEGSAPHRPRYLLPDYGRLLADGSDFLELDAPKDLDEVLTTLLIAYTQVPSITGYPVWLGDLDALVEPYVGDVDDAELRRRLRLFWISLDRMLPDAFVHANLGPDDSRVGRVALSLERELQQVVPNLSLKVDPARTPDSYVLDAVRTVFECGQPHFVNHPMMVSDLGEGYGVASCYNSLRVGGGSYTLVRLNLREVALRHRGSLDDFFRRELPLHVELACELIEARTRYIVEGAGFFESSWLAHEGLVSPDRMTAMFGIYGLAEAVQVLADRRYGHDDEADALANDVVVSLYDLVAARPIEHLHGTGGRALLHSQAGIDTDDGVTAGARVPIGEEPPLARHLRAVTPNHRWFPAGVSDVLAFDETARRNPEAVVDVVRGAFATGMRDLTFNLDSNDFIRITGYLVRKSDLAALHASGGARHGSTLLGAGSVERSHVDQRSPKRVTALEVHPRSAR